MSALGTNELGICSDTKDNGYCSRHNSFFYEKKKQKNRFAGIKMGSISQFKKSFFTCLFLDLKSFLTKELSKATHKKHYLSRQ